LATILLVSVLHARPFRSPEEFHSIDPSPECGKSTNFVSVGVTGFVRFYQNVISPIKGENCRMYPSCSHFAIEALKVHGLRGILMSSDRLHRCGHDLKFYQRMIVDDRVLYRDLPLSR
jgi:putative membrane protein insertion efficiency factor